MASSSSADLKTATTTATAAAATTNQVVRSTSTGVEVVNEPTIPAAAPGSAVVKIRCANVGTYLKSWILEKKNPFPTFPPFTPGTYAYGTVAAVARDVHGLAVGTTVVYNPYMIHGNVHLLSGLCSFTAVSTDDEKAFVERWKNGTWAQYAVLKADQLIVVPEEYVSGTKALSARQLSTFDYLPIAYRAVCVQGRVRAGQSVLVNGATGNLGTAAVQLALASGASKVFAAGRSADKLRKLTALCSRVHAIQLDEKDTAPATTMKAAIGTSGVDLYIDFLLAGISDNKLTVAGINQVKFGGIAVVAGGVSAPIGLDYFNFVLRQLTVSGSFMYNSSEIETCLRLVASGSINTSSYTSTDFVGLSSVNDAINAASTVNDGFHSVLLFPNGK